jgi:hypothetical protein
MVNNKKCGNNLMQASENTISFTASPTGEGKWYATRKYHVLNCLVEKITLKQNSEEHLIESPFGLLNATQQDKQIIYNHNTIVWGKITSNFSSTIPLFDGQGYLELTQTDVNNNISRLVDTQRQIEISFYNNPDRLSYVQAAFPVVGMPKTFLIFPTNTSENLYRIYKHTFELCKTPETPNSVEIFEKTHGLDTATDEKDSYQKK